MARARPPLRERTERPRRDAHLLPPHVPQRVQPSVRLHADCHLANDLYLFPRPDRGPPRKAHHRLVQPVLWLGFRPRVVGRFASVQHERAVHVALRVARGDVRDPLEPKRPHGGADFW